MQDNNSIPNQTFTEETPLDSSYDNEVSRAETLLREVSTASNEAPVYNPGNSNRFLFGRSVAQIFAIAVVMLGLIIGVGAAGVLRSSHNNNGSGGNGHELLAGVSNQKDQDQLQVNDSLLEINRSTVVNKNFAATGNVLIQSNQDSDNAFRIQSASGSNILIADTSEKKITIGNNPAGQVSLNVNGDISVNGQLVSTSQGYSLNSQGLTLNGVLVCTANGCISRNAQANPDLSIYAKKSDLANYALKSDLAGYAQLNTSQTFTADNSFTGKVAVGGTVVGAGAQLQVTGSVNTTVGYQVNGSTGSSLTCAPGELLQQPTIVGGIIISGSCVPGAGASVATLQQSYDASVPATIVLNNASGMLQIQDNASPLATNLFEVTSNGGATKYFAVNSAGASVAGTFNATTLQQGGIGVLTQSTNFSGDISGTFNSTVIGVGVVNSSKILDGTITNADISATAAIAYGKLNLAGSIVNSDVSNAAAIAYSKLNLTGNIVNADISAAASISYSKLNLSNSIVNGDIAAAAGIAYSKLSLNNSIVNADIAAGANIADTKLNTISTAGKVADSALSSNVALLNRSGQTFTGTNSFSSTITAPGITGGGAALGIGASGDTLNLNGTYSSDWVVTNGTDSTTIAFSGVPTGNVVYDFDVAATPGTYTICTSVGNCVGVAGGAIGGSGTANKLAKFTGSGFTIGDSILTDNGTTVSVAGTLNATTLQQGGTSVLLQTTAFSGDVSGTYNSLSVDKLKGTPLSISSLANTNFLIYNSTSGNWENHSLSSDLTVSNTGVATIANGAVNSLKIADGTIANIDISATAAIDYSKLNLNASIQDSDVAAGSHFAFTNAANTFTAAQLIKVNDAGALQVQDSSSATILAVDSLSNRIVINNLSFAGTGNIAQAITKSMVVTSAVNANDVVIIDTANPGQVTTTSTGNSNLVYGVATATKLAGQTQDVVIGGTYQVNVDATSTVAVGDFIATSGTTGKVTTNNNPAAGTILGRALSAVTIAGAGQTVWVQVTPDVGGGSAGTGVTSVGTIDSQTKSADGGVISGTALYFQTADAGAPGLVSTVAQTFAGNKTFNGTVNATTLQQGGTGVLLQTTAFSGDVSGTYNSTSVDKLKGTALSIASLADTNVLIYNSTSGNWENHSISGDITIDHSGVSAIGVGKVTSSNILDGTITNADISASAGIVDTKLNTISTAGKVADSALSNNVALKNGNNAFTGNNTFTLNTAGLAVQDAASPLGTNLFEVTNNAGTTKYFTVSATALQFLGNDVCTTAGNCTGVSGGSIGGSGTNGTIAKFTPDGFNIGNSIITDNGSTVTIGGVLAVNTITPTATLTVGTPTQTLTLQGDASTSLSAKSGSITNSLVFATPAVSNKTITLPNASGTVAVSASGPLALDAAGNLTCPTCLTSGGGGSAGVTDVNSINGSVTLAGTANQIIITPSTGTLTFSTPQDINTTSSVDFANVNVSSNIKTGGTARIDNAGNLTNINNADIGGSLALKKGTDVSTTPTINNLSVTTSLVRLTGASAQTLTGVANGRDGYVLTIINAGSATATIANNSVSSLAGNRITTGTGADYGLPVGSGITLIYDATDSLWRMSATGTGVNAVGALDSQTASADGAVIVGNSIYLQSASATNAGLVNTGAQTFAGNKTFNGTVNANLLQQGGTGVLLQTTAFSGDVSGTYNSTSVDKLKGTALSIASLADTNILIYNSTSGNWENHSISGDITINNSGVSAIGVGKVTSSNILDGTIANIDISGTAAIAYSKLNLAGSIVNADIAAGANISDTKLNTISTAGKVADSALSSNVALLNRSGQTFTDTNAFQANSATAFQVQSSSAADTLLTANTVTRAAGTAGNTIKIGNSTGTDTDTTILIVDSATANPTTNLGSLNGGLFYNSTNNKLSVIENGAVKELCNKTDLGCGSAGATQTLATVYANGSNQTDETILLDSTRNGVLIRDNATPITGTLFGVQNSTGGTKYLDVTATGVSVAGTIAATGNINSSGGAIQTGGFNRIDNAGNLVNIGTINGNTLDNSGNLTFGVAGTANIDAATGQQLNLGAGGGAHNTSLGSATGASATTVQSGSGGVILSGNTSISGARTFTSGTGTVTLQGATDVSASVSFATKRGATFTTPGTTVDASLSTASLYILDTSAGAQTIDSIVAGRDGQYLTLVNADTSLAVTIRDASTATTTTAANKISTGLGSDVTLNAGSSINLVYDTTANLWRVVGSVATSGAGTCPTCANQQLSNLFGTVAINLDLNPNADNTLDLGSAANSWKNVYADTAVLTPAVDVATAGTLGIGNTTATGVSICNSANCDTITIGTNADADTIQIGDANDTITITGNSSSSFVLNGVTISAAELNLLDGHGDLGSTLVDTNDAVNTAITGTGALNSGSITSGFGAIDVGADNITTTGSVFGNTFDRTTSGTLNIGNTNANAISLGANTTVAGTATFTVNGGNTSLGANLDVTSSVAFKHGVDVSTTPSLDDLNVGNVSLIRLTGASTQTLTGVANGRDGYILTIVNAAGQAAVIANQSASSTTPADRIITGTGGNITLPVDGSATLVYDSQAARWRVVGDVNGGSGSGVTSVGTFTSCTSYANGAQISGGVITFSCADVTNPGMVSTGAQTFLGAKQFNSLVTANAGLTAANGAISLTGNAASSLTTTSGALTLDAATAVNVGAINATSVTLGNTTNTTAISLQGAAGATYLIGTSANTGGITLGNSTATNTISIGSAAGASATQTINIGTSATASSTTNVTIGSAIGSSATTIKSGTGGINLTADGSSNTGIIAKTTNNSTAAFQIQNAAGAQLLNVDSSTSQNLIVTNPGFEISTSGWSAKNGSGTSALAQVSSTTTAPYQGNYSMRVTTTGVDATNAGASYNVTLSAATTYSLSMYVKASGSAPLTTLQIGRSEDGSTDTSCATALRAEAYKWTRLTCTFTTGDAPSGTTYIYIKQTDATNHTYFVDDMQLEPKTNLLTNPGAESALGSEWAALANTNAPVRSTTAGHFNSGVAGIDVTPTTTGTNRGVKNVVSLSSNTTYTLSVYAKDPSATATGMEIGRSEDGSTFTPCSSNLTIGTSFTQLSCSFTTGTTSGSTFVYIRDLNSRANTAPFYVDSAQLYIGTNTSATAYQLGQIAINSVITSPLSLRNQSDSTTAFQIQNTSGANLFTADTANSAILMNGDVSIGTNMDNLLFSDNFESGWTKLWDTSSGVTPTVQTSIVHNGRYAMQYTPNGSSSSYLKTAIGGSTVAYERAWVYVASQSSISLEIMAMDNGAGLGYNYIVYRNNSSQVCINSHTGTAHCGGNFTANAWHLAELKIGMGSSTGTTQLWLDGNLVYSSTTEDNAAPGSIARARVGSEDASENGTAYIDDFAVSSTQRNTTSASLNVQDSLHVGGSSSFGGQVQITPSANTDNTFVINNSSGTPLFEVNTINSGSISQGQTNINTTEVNIQGNANSINAFVLQNSGGSKYIQADTSTAKLSLLDGGIASTIQIGNTTGAVAQTINIGTNSTASSINTVNIGSTIGTSPLTLQAGTSGVLVKPANGTTALQVQNASSTALLTADTSNMRLGVDVTYALMSAPTGLTSTASTGTGFTAGQSYLYEVTAIDSAGGETGVSNEPAACAPATTNLRCSLAWTAVAGASGYKVYRTANGGASGTEKYLTTVLKNSYIDSNAITLSTTVPPSSNTAYISTNNSNQSLQVSVGGLGKPTGQLYVSGTLPIDVSAGGVATALGPVSVAVQGRYAYVVANNASNKLQVFDVSNPASPVDVSGGGVTTASGPRSVSVQGRYAYVADNSANKLQVFDVSNPTSPTDVSGGGVTTGSSPISVSVQGRYAYVADNTANKLQVFDVSNPASPVDVSGGGVTTGTNPLSVFVQGRYAYVADFGANKLQIFDVSNPASPVDVSGGGVTTGSNPQSVTVQGRYAYVADFGAAKLQIFDVSNPASPVDVSGGGVSTALQPDFTYVQGRYAYVTTSSSAKLQVFDVSNPASPVDVSGGGVTTGSNPFSVFVLGRYAYVALDGTNKLQVFDLGGTYTQQLEAGGAEFGTLGVDGNANFGGDASIRGGLTLGASLQAAGSIATAGNLYVQGSTSFAGGILGGTTINNLSTPGTPTVTTVGTTGTQTWKYRIVAVNAAGATTSAGAEGSTTSANGVSTLTASNYQQVSWTAVPGAVGYKVYRTAVAATTPSPATLGCLNSCALVTSTSLNDTGLAGDASSFPTTDSSGNFTVNGLLSLQPATSLIAGQSAVTSTFTNADTTGGTVNGYNQSITVSNASGTTITNGFNISLTDNTALGNINNGVNISLSGSNTSQAQVGVKSTVSNGIGIVGRANGGSSSGSSCGNYSFSYGVGVCGIAYQSGTTNTSGTGVVGISNGGSTSINSGNVTGVGVSGRTGAAGTAGEVYTGVQGLSNQSTAAAYSSIGSYGYANGGAGATVYGGYFTLGTSGAVLGSALYASNSTVAANILQLQDGSSDVLVVGDGGSVSITPSDATKTITLGSTTQTGTITLGQSTATNTVSIGAAAGAAATQTINIGTSSTASSTTNVNIGSSVAGTTAVTGATTITNRTSGSADTLVVGNSTSTGNIAVFKDNSSPVLTIADGGNSTFGGNVLGSAAATGTTGTTSGTGGSNVTSITLSAAGSFANNDVIFVDNTGGSGQDFYTRITAGAGTTTLTVSPAVSYGTAAGYTGNATITKYTVQNIGATATDYTTQAQRFFQGYFLGGVVTGAGSTTLSDQMLQSSTNLNIQAGSGNLTLDSSATVSIGDTNATGVSICNSANCDTISIGTNADADTINIGDATDTFTLTGGSSSTIVIGGNTISATELSQLDGITNIHGNGLTVSSGALTIALQAATATGASATTSSGSGLEVLSGGLTLLQGCSDGQILKWTEATGVWGCAADNGGVGSNPTLQDAYNNGAAGDQVIQLSSTNDALIIRNPSSSGANSGTTPLYIDQLATGNQGGITVNLAADSAIGTSTRTGLSIATGAITETAASTGTFNGISLLSPGAVSTTTAAGTLNWNAANFTVADTTANFAGSTVASNGLQITTGTLNQTAGIAKENGLNIDIGGNIASGTFNGLKIGASSARTISGGTITGLNVDLNTNISANGVGITGLSVATPGDSGAGAANFVKTGLTISSGSITLNTANTSSYTGEQISIPSLTANTSSSAILTGIGLQILGGSMSSANGAAVQKLGISVSFNGASYSSGDAYGLNVYVPSSSGANFRGINIAAGSSTTITTGSYYGMYLDLNTNITATGASLTGLYIATPADTAIGSATKTGLSISTGAITETSAATTGTYNGISLLSPGSISTTTAAGTLNWNAANLTIADATANFAGSTITANGLKITTGTLTQTAGTLSENGLFIDNSVGTNTSGNLRGIRIGLGDLSNGVTYRGIEISASAARNFNQASVTGMLIDLSTNVTATNNSSVTGLQIQTPGDTNIWNGVKKGLFVTSGNIIENNAGGTGTSVGIDVISGNLTLTTGTALNAYGLRVTTGNMTQTVGTITQNGIYVDSGSTTFTTGGTLNGVNVNVGALSSAANYRGINISTNGTSRTFNSAAGVTGLNIDLNSNVSATGTNEFGISLSTSADSNINAATKYGLSIQSGNITETSAASGYYIGANILVPTLTANNASAILEGDGLKIQTGSIVQTSGAVTQNGLFVDTSGGGLTSGMLNGLKIGGVSDPGPAVTSNAITIGAGWDKQINGNGWSVDGVGNLTVLGCTGCSGSSVSLQNAYTGGAAGDQVITLSSTNDSIIVRNPSSSGSDSGTYTFMVDQLSTGSTGGLDIQSAGTGNLLRVRDTTATAADVFTIADGGATTFKNQTNSTTGLQIQNSSGSSLFTADTSGFNLTELGGNGGAVQSWASTSAINVGAVSKPREAAASVVANGYVYEIGGTANGTTPLNTVYYAKLNANGTIGSWAATTSVVVSGTQNRVLASAATANGYLYLVGGFDGTNTRDTVYYTKLNADGTIGSWAATSAINVSGSQPRDSHTTVVSNGYLYVIGGEDNTAATPRDTVYYAKLNADGTIGSWAATSAINVSSTSKPTAAHTSVVANGYVYVIGGSNSTLSFNLANSTVYYAPLNSDGTIGSWAATTSINVSGAQARMYHSSVVLNGRLYVIGGQDSTPTVQSTVYDAPINSDGTIGTWASTTALNVSGAQPREQHTSVVSNGYIYTLGGTDGSAIKDTVYYASTSRTQVYGSLDLVGLQAGDLVNGGGLSVGSSGGSITAGNITAVGGLQVQGQGNFAGGIAGPDWAIDGTGALKVSSASIFSSSVPNPTTDILSIGANMLSNTSGVDGLAINFGTGNASGDAIHIIPSYIGGATDALTYNGIELDAFSPTNGAGTDTINGIKIGNLTDPGATITSNAINIGTGWDKQINGNGWSVDGSGNLTVTSCTGCSSAFTSTSGVITQSTATDQLNLVEGEAGDYGLKVSTSVAPTVDLVQIINGNASATNGVDGLAISFTASNASGDALHITPSFSSSTTALTYNAFEIDGFSPTNSTGTDTVNGLSIGNLTDPGATIASTGLNIGTGWDTDIKLNDATSVIQTAASSSGSANTISINNTNAITMFQLRDLTGNSNAFGGLVVGDAFAAKQSYFGEEFNSNTADCINNTFTTATNNESRGTQITGRAVGATPCTTTAGDNNTTEISTSSVSSASNVSNTCTYGQNAAATNTNGIEKITIGVQNGTPTVECMEYIGTSTDNTGNKIFNTASLPQIQMKWRPTIPASGRRFFLGISDKVTAAASMATGDHGAYFTNCTAPTTPTCGTGWVGAVSDGTTAPNSATSANAVACPATDSDGNAAQTTNFMYGRIEFRKKIDNTTGTAVEIEYFIDYDVTNGIHETSCGTITSTGASNWAVAGGTNMTMLAMAVNAASNTTTTLEMDYFRVWQDDTASPAATTTTDSSTSLMSDAPLTTDSSGGTPPPDFDPATILAAMLALPDPTTTAQNAGRLDTGYLTAVGGIVSPNVTTDKLAVNNIRAATGSDVGLQLGDNGQFVVTNSSNQPVFSVDAQGNVHIAGQVTADKVVANQIEGLEVLTDKISSLSDALAAAGGTTSGSSVSGSGSATGNPVDFTMTTATFQSVNIALDLNVMGNLTVNGALTIVGDANFLGNVKFGSHLTTDGQVLATSIETGAGITTAVDSSSNLANATVDGNDISGQVSVKLGDNATVGKLVTLNFAKTYAKAPHIVLTPANGATSSLQYYVTATTDGFTITITGGQLTPGATLIFNYLVVE